MLLCFIHCFDFGSVYEDAPVGSSGSDRVTMRRRRKPGRSRCYRKRYY